MMTDSCMNELDGQMNDTQYTTTQQTSTRPLIFKHP